MQQNIVERRVERAGQLRVVNQTSPEHVRHAQRIIERRAEKSSHRPLPISS
jgi:hypothetical protein